LPHEDSNTLVRDGFMKAMERELETSTHPAEGTDSFSDGPRAKPQAPPAHAFSDGPQ
jgi:hypothetical protein